MTLTVSHVSYFYTTVDLCSEAVEVHKCFFCVLFCSVYELSSVINIHDGCLNADHPGGAVNALASGPAGRTVGTRLKLSGDLRQNVGVYARLRGLLVLIPRLILFCFKLSGRLYVVQ